MQLSGVRLVAVTAISAALAFAPAASAAQIVLDPPGKAGANQYFETIPTSNGNAAPPSGTPSKPPAIDSAGPGNSALKQLQKLGADGQAAASFAQASAPTVSHTGGHGQSNATGSSKSGTSTGSPGAAAASATGSSALSGIFRVLGGSDAGGIGVFMPILLIGSLLSAILAAGWRRHRDDAPAAPPA